MDFSFKPILLVDFTKPVAQATVPMLLLQLISSTYFINVGLLMS